MDGVSSAKAGVSIVRMECSSDSPTTLGPHLLPLSHELPKPHRATSRTFASRIPPTPLSLLVFFPIHSIDNRGTPLCAPRASAACTSYPFPAGTFLYPNWMPRAPPTTPYAQKKHFRRIVALLLRVVSRHLAPTHVVCARRLHDEIVVEEVILVLRV